MEWIEIYFKLKVIGEIIGAGVLGIMLVIYISIWIINKINSEN